jgi:hypothetical protein
MNDATVAEAVEFDDPIERRRWLAKSVANAKGHARKASRPFELTIEFIETLYAQQEGRCAVTGLRFDQRRVPEALVKHPFASSIDRISSRGVYTTDNVRLVCIAVNFGMGQRGEEVFLTLARAAADHEKRERFEPSTDLNTWKAGYRERIAAAEALLPSLPENEQPKQRPHIASLKRVLTLGPEGLRKAAERAYRNRSEVPV